MLHSGRWHQILAFKPLWRLRFKIMFKPAKIYRFPLVCGIISTICSETKNIWKSFSLSFFLYGYVPGNKHDVETKDKLLFCELIALITLQYSFLSLLVSTSAPVGLICSSLDMNLILIKKIKYLFLLLFISLFCLSAHFSLRQPEYFFFKTINNGNLIL